MSLKQGAPTASAFWVPRLTPKLKSFIFYCPKCLLASTFLFPVVFCRQKPRQSCRSSGTHEPLRQGSEQQHTANSLLVPDKGSFPFLWNTYPTALPIKTSFREQSHCTWTNFSTYTESLKIHFQYPPHLATTAERLGTLEKTRGPWPHNLYEVATENMHILQEK